METDLQSTDVSAGGITGNGIFDSTFIFDSSHRLDKWGKQDSNLRRLSHQIYSLAPLAAREFPLNHKLLNERRQSVTMERPQSAAPKGAGS